MNRRLLVVTLMLAAVAWALALGHGDRLRPRSEPVPAARPPAQAPPQEAVPAQRPVEPQPAPRVVGRQPAAAVAPPPGIIAPDDPYRQKLAAAITEQRRLNDDRFARAKEHWPHEPRQEPWAAERELELRSALQHDGIDARVVSLECRATLCRLQLEAQDSNAAFAVNGAHELAHTAGSQVSSGMTGNGFDRRMILFLPREGPGH